MGHVGLVLTGGGARAAYQVGAIRALAELSSDERATPFSVLTGVSAGAVNAVSIAAGADDFTRAARRLAKLWLSLTPERVYRTDAKNLVSIGSRWLRELTGGGFLAASRINYLLDTAPLRAFLKEHLPMDRLGEHFRSGRLRGVAVSATNYFTGTGFTFFDGAKDIQPWLRSTRIGVRESLTLDHVMASTAIPIFFPPVRIRDVDYGDGCVRMSAPVSPAIHLGADRIVAIAVRHLRTPQHNVAVNVAPREHALTISEIAGVLMNAVFLDALDFDVERLERINRTLSFIPPERYGLLAQPLRPIPILVLRPSEDLGALAADQVRRFPRTLRYLLKGIGAAGEGGSDLLSYLAFEPVYVRRLVRLGYRDTLARREEVRAFCAGEPARARGPAA